MNEKDGELTREQRLALCKYYKGEDKNPYKVERGWFWDMEWVFVRNTHAETAKIESDYFHMFVDLGKCYDIPADLVHVMFGSWGKYAYYIEKEMPDFYERCRLYKEMQP